MDTTNTSPQFLTPEELAEDEAAALKAKKQQKKIQEKAIVDRLTNQILCQDNPQRQAAELVVCENDILYFINNFVFTYDPREPYGEQDIPMLTYQYQKDFIGWLCHHIDATVNGIAKRTMVVEKSRDVGASWILVGVAVHYWLFKGGSIHFGSRTYDEADMLGDMGSLVEKVRFVIRRLPKWMWPVGFNPDKDMSFANIKNPASNNQITAEAASPEFCRGDRKTFVVMDEYASWDNDEAALKAVQGGSTNALVLISTPKGPFNKFAKLANGEDKVQVEKYRIHWTQHPVKSAGLRTLEGKPTSYWYRQQCAAMTAEDIASELDIKYETSTKGLIFDDYQEIHRGHNLSPIGSGRILRIQDPGVHWFVLFAQIDPYGRMLVFDEHYDEQAYVGDICYTVKEKSQRFKGYQFDDCGDPNGENRQAGSQELSDYDVMREEDIDPDTSMFDGVAPGLKVKARITRIHEALRTYNHRTKTCNLLIDVDRCPILDKALREGYRRKVNAQTKQVLDTVKEIHPFEDAVDCLGMGFIHKLGMPGTNSNKTVEIAQNKTVWNGVLRKRAS